MKSDKKLIAYDVDTTTIDKANAEVVSKAKASGSALSSIAASIAKSLTAAFYDAAKAVMIFGMDFESSIAKVSTLFGDIAVDTEILQTKILELSNSSGVAAAELGNSLYNALSAGIPITEDMGVALTFLEKCTRLAKAGFADVDTVVNSTAKILKTYKMDVSEIDKIHKILMQTQKVGNIAIGEFDSVLTQIIPTAAAFGVSFEQVGAAIAVMTTNEIPAAQAATQLIALIAELGKTGTTAAKSLENATEGTEHAGKSFQQLAAAGMPLNEMLDLIGDYADKNGLSMLDMFDSIEAGNAALANSGHNSQAFADALVAMGTEADVVGEAFDKVSGTSADQFARILNELKNAAIELYTDIAPIAEQLLPVLKDAIAKLLPVISNILQTILPVLLEMLESLLPLFVQLVELLEPILDLFIALVEPILELIMGALTPLVEILTAILQPILDLLMLALTPLLELITPIIDVILQLMDTALRPLMDVFNTIFGVISDTVLTQIGAVTDVLKGVMDFIKNIFTGNWSGAWESVKNIFLSIWNGIKDVGKSTINALITIFEKGLNGIIKFINTIASGLSKIWDWTGIPSIPKIPEVSIPRLQIGADFIPQDKFPAFLDYGERVLTAEDNSKFNDLGGLEGMERMLGGMAFSQTEAISKVHVVVQGDVEMDGFKVGTVVMRNIDDVRKFI